MNEDTQDGSRLVLVTGATGFTGLHATAALRAAGHRVRVLVRSAEKARQLLEPLGIGADDVVVGDMTERDAVRRAARGCDAVIHAAAVVSVTGAADERAFDANAEGARVVLGEANAAGLDPIVFVSSLTAILDPKRPELTSAASPLVASATRYGQSKADSDRLARALADEGAPITIVYPSAILGPDDPGRSESMSAFRGFLQFMIDSEGGTQFVDARDLAALFVRIVETRCHGRLVAAGHYLDWADLRSVIAGTTGASIRAIRAPGFVLRGAGRLADVAAKLTGRRLMFGHEAMEVATRWRAIADSPEIAGLGVVWRAPTRTLEDVYRWFLERGAIPAKSVPKLKQHPPVV